MSSKLNKVASMDEFVRFQMEDICWLVLGHIISLEISSHQAATVDYQIAN